MNSKGSPRAARACFLMLVCALCALLTTAGTAAAETACQTDPPGPQQPGPALAEPVTLKPEPAKPILNLGDEAEVDLVFVADKTLPRNLRPEQLAASSRRFQRSNDQLPNAYIDKPTFTKASIEGNRKEVIVTVCIDDSDVEAGTYSAPVTLSGPEGLTAESVALTVNSKDEDRYVWGAIIAGLVALLLLIMMAGRVAYDAQAAEKKSTKEALEVPLRGLFSFWFPTVIAIGAAELAMYEVFTKDVAWGANGLGSFIELAGVALTATGLTAAFKVFTSPVK
jgi:hypothetical protein